MNNIEAQEAEYAALKAEREGRIAAERKLALARKHLDRVTAPRSVAEAKARFSAAWGELEAFDKAKHEATLNRYREMSDEQLTARLVSAADYSYEAQMSDYSIGSINSAARESGNLKQVAEERGWNPREVIEAERNARKVASK